ncbi:hypothetical protein [Caminibacter pacificus]|uniref:Uncharacterized protein n=1 Tax=Caminibacter pacificus TaxID=1424653 RepID=A0AAJ4RCY2_9BACT|nr:hypothetical protein [Caminibacter pacificus]NPA87439.1 hypothetical protein [Campylobacterota bacterium]QCI27749.1 hypothetical protein C6V80_01835 [Caminibacter pacificus]ROR40077.1 hypothetical protein EDC58_1061 [Caminibacter pacificus]
MVGVISNSLIIALIFNLIAILLAACACINSVMILNLQNNPELKIEGIVSVTIILLLSYASNLIAAYNYKKFFAKQQKYKYASNLILAGALMSLIPVGEVLILIGWLLIAINLIMSK